MPIRRVKQRTPRRESVAAENYLKCILALAMRGTDGRARSRVLMSEIAAALRLTRGTVTTQVKRLAREGLVRYERYGGVELSGRGERRALGVLHRHRLVETFLVSILGLDWSEVHIEAERLEHALSDRVLEALDRWMGHPTVDPHGDPIPRAAMRAEAGGRSLAEGTAGERLRVERLIDQTPSFLRYASQRGLTPGAEFEILGNEAKSRGLRVRSPRGRVVVIDRRRASRVLVATASAGERGHREGVDRRHRAAIRDGQLIPPRRAGRRPPRG